MLPILWTRIEPLPDGNDYRLPYELSKDYWLYERMTGTLESNDIAVVGDSVVWGEYVRPDGTLSHFLNQELSDEPFINAGVNGLFPLALEGLIKHYGKTIRNRKVLLHCNLLWLSSPEADLSSSKEQAFNHQSLVPQFVPRILCYKADIDERLGIVFQNHLPILQWVNHLKNAYFDQQDIYQWTLADDGKYPQGYLNSYRNPLRQITMTIPEESPNDPDRGPTSARHHPWSSTGIGTQVFDWVKPEMSLQWKSFQRLMDLILKRNNDLLVILGPFNRHIMASENQNDFIDLRKRILADFKNKSIPVINPELLPSKLYGDASHPLTAGYALLAKRLANHPEFNSWLNR
ncbi:MAG TPA: SGNH/GDSL hydrolase family protein [Verrucomicrobia bacterium]|nr:SGNH/GDSL hydrolase family protein [Verrucomicrobiota bacterium]